MTERHERPDHDTAERAFRELLQRSGLPAPDEVARWRDALVFGWRDTKSIVVVDLDELDVDDLEAAFEPVARAG